MTRCCRDCGCALDAGGNYCKSCRRLHSNAAAAKYQCKKRAERKGEREAEGRHCFDCGCDIDPNKLHSLRCKPCQYVRNNAADKVAKNLRRSDPVQLSMEREAVKLYMRNVREI